MYDTLASCLTILQCCIEIVLCSLQSTCKVCLHKLPSSWWSQLPFDRTCKKPHATTHCYWAGCMGWCHDDGDMRALAGCSVLTAFLLAALVKASRPLVKAPFLSNKLKSQGVSVLMMHEGTVDMSDRSAVRHHGDYLLLACLHR